MYSTHYCVSSRFSPKHQYHSKNLKNHGIEDTTTKQAQRTISYRRSGESHFALTTTAPSQASTTAATVATTAPILIVRLVVDCCATRFSRHTQPNARPWLSIYWRTGNAQAKQTKTGVRVRAGRERGRRMAGGGRYSRFECQNRKTVDRVSPEGLRGVSTGGGWGGVERGGRDDEGGTHLQQLSKKSTCSIKAVSYTSPNEHARA